MSWRVPSLHSHLASPSLCASFTAVAVTVYVRCSGGPNEGRLAVECRVPFVTSFPTRVSVPNVAHPHFLRCPTVGMGIVCFLCSVRVAFCRPAAHSLAALCDCPPWEASIVGAPPGAALKTLSWHCVAPTCTCTSLHLQNLHMGIPLHVPMLQSRLCFEVVDVPVSVATLPPPLLLWCTVLAAQDFSFNTSIIYRLRNHGDAWRT